MLKWDHLKSLLYFYERGSLIGAARDLECDHTTIGRHLEQLSEDLNMKLRSDQQITEGALKLVPQLKEIERLINEIKTRGKDQ